eukprot:gene10307-11371_t
MFCSHCGAISAEESKFCSKCGKVIVGNSPSTGTSPSTSCAGIGGPLISTPQSPQVLQQQQTHSSYQHRYAHLKLTEQARAQSGGNEYVLTYAEGKSAQFMPGTADFLNLAKYREDVGTDFKRITFYLCKLDDHIVSEYTGEEYYEPVSKSVKLDETPTLPCHADKEYLNIDSFFNSDINYGIATETELPHISTIQHAVNSGNSIEDKCALKVTHTSEMSYKSKLATLRAALEDKEENFVLLSVRRRQNWQDTCQKLGHLFANGVKRIVVSFIGEEAADGGDEMPDNDVQEKLRNIMESKRKENFQRNMESFPGRFNFGVTCMKVKFEERTDFVHDLLSTSVFQSAMRKLQREIKYTTVSDEDPVSKEGCDIQEDIIYNLTNFFETLEIDGAMSMPRIVLDEDGKENEVIAQITVE